MDISNILKVVVCVLAVIGTISVVIKMLIPSMVRVGLGGVLLVMIIILLFLRFVLPIGSTQETIMAFVALMTLVFMGTLTVLRWFKIVPDHRSLHT